MTTERHKRRWSKAVHTESTFPPPGTFTKPAKQVADMMAKKSVSPKGIGSAIKMIQFFINRAGSKLTSNRKHELEKAKKLLQMRQRQAK